MGQVIPMPGAQPFENPALPHQIVLRLDRRGWLYVSCTCLLRGGRRIQLACALVLPAADARRIWIEHVNQENDNDEQDTTDDASAAAGQLRSCR